MENINVKVNDTIICVIKPLTKGYFAQTSITGAGYTCNTLEEAFKTAEEHFIRISTQDIQRGFKQAKRGKQTL